MNTCSGHQMCWQRIFEDLGIHCATIQKPVAVNSTVAVPHTAPVRHVLIGPTEVQAIKSMESVDGTGLPTTYGDRLLQNVVGDLASLGRGPGQVFRKTRFVPVDGSPKPPQRGEQFVWISKNMAISFQLSLPARSRRRRKKRKSTRS